jgi:periplasmic divalent cation tolerance protein
MRVAKRRVLHAMAYVTAPDRSTARRIARAIIARRLAACANLWRVESMYRWRGKLEETNEFVIVFKTRRSLLEKVIAEVRRIHPYDVPCIVSYPMGPAHEAFGDWIDSETAQR